MSYKVKSALYFVCFLTAVTICYSVENNSEIDSLTEKMNYTGAELEGNTSTSVTLHSMK
jgi:hypothetical protein